MPFSHQELEVRVYKHAGITSPALFKFTINNVPMRHGCYKGGYTKNTCTSKKWHVNSYNHKINNYDNLYWLLQEKWGYTCTLRKVRGCLHFEKSAGIPAFWRKCGNAQGYLHFGKSAGIPALSRKVWVYPHFQEKPVNIQS